jgi:hypothetical protein
MAFNVREWLGAVRTIDGLLALEPKIFKMFGSQNKRLDDLADRINRLEAREAVLIAEAKGAAGAAASAVAASHLGELSRLYGGLEERVLRLEGDDGRVRRLTAPEK